MTNIKISDGTESERMKETDIDSAIATYVKDFGFNEPGDVECVVYTSDEADPQYNDWTPVRTFMIRSDDGRSGYLVTD